MKRYLLYAPAVVFLFLFLLRVPIPVPTLILPRAVFMTLEASPTPEAAFSSLQNHPEIHLLADGGLHSIRREEFETPARLGAYLEEQAREDFTHLEGYLDQIAARTPRFTRIKVIFSSHPRQTDIAVLRRLQEVRGIPVEFEVLPAPHDPLLLSYSYTFASRETALDFDILFAPSVRRYDSVEVLRNGAVIDRFDPAALANGRHYRSALPAEEDSILEFRIRGQGTVLSRNLTIPAQGEEDAQVLMVSERRDSVSFLEKLYTTKKTTLSRALEENVLEYPLLVFDGIPLQSIGPQLTGVVEDIYEQRTASLLFVSDSPAFGAPGDNPGIEKLLPVELAPRTLRYLPDMEILIALDISASMSGEKLSLAKVSTLELIENLKDSDRISILAFWHSFRFLHDFEEKRNLNSEFQLAPLTAQGGTDLYGALREGLRRLTALQMPQRHVIILSDGKTKEGDFDSLIEQAQREDITVSTLAVGEEINTRLLTRLAVESGGNYYRVASLEEIPSLIFEDRREIARSSFARDVFPISDFRGVPVSRVSGMSLFTPKSERILLYKNQYEDPLMILEKRDRQLVAMLLSDLYGVHTEDFLSNASVIRTLQRTFDPVLRKNRISIRIAEACGTASVSASGEGLIDPVLAVYADNNHLLTTELDPGSFRTYSASLPLFRSGRYSGILYSAGNAITRFPIYFNGTMDGQSTESHLELHKYRTRSFRLLPASKIYLVLFFIASVAVTFVSRQIRVKTKLGKK